MRQTYHNHYLVLRDNFYEIDTSYNMFLSLTDEYIYIIMYVETTPIVLLF